MTRILVTGGTGFLGSYVVRSLLTKGHIVHPAPHAIYDLTRREDTARLLYDSKPEIVIHLAAVVGGIGFNQLNPVSCVDDNLLINTHVISESHKAGVKKFVAVGSVCAYPRNTSPPFIESELWRGFPEETNAPYGLAKRMLLVQCHAYRKQHGLNAIYLIPTNLYGPGQGSDLNNSHVIPALIRKMLNASPTNPEVELWGTGTATRDFLHVQDCADAIVTAMERYNDPEPVNLGSGQQISISDLAGMLAKEIGINPRFVRESALPDGQPMRCLDTSRAKAFGWRAKISLEYGLQETVEWYRTNLNNSTTVQPTAYAVTKNSSG